MSASKFRILHHQHSLARRSYPHACYLQQGAAAAVAAGEQRMETALGSSSSARCVSRGGLHGGGGGGRRRRRSCSRGSTGLPAVVNSMVVRQQQQQHRFAGGTWRDEPPRATYLTIFTGTLPPRRAGASDVQVRLLDGRLNMPQNMEEVLEKVIYDCRFFALLGVLGSLVGSVLCFLKGCEYIATSFMEYFVTGGKVMSVLIKAMDVYLIGTVMFVFGMGLYELFISNLDIGKTSSQRSNFLGMFMLQERPKWLEIQSVNELKTKVGHVIVMVLLVGLFDKIQKVGINTPKDLLCFAASILLSSCGLYLLSKLSIARSTNK